MKALAIGGPLGGSPNLTVDADDPSEAPGEVVWSTGPGSEHLYRFKTVALNAIEGGLPLYEYVRTLSPDDAT